MGDEEEHSSSDLTVKTIVFNSIAVLVLIAIICGAIYYVHWYKTRDHSSYARLTETTYNQNGMSYTFKYPSVMTANAKYTKKLQDVPIAYAYSSNGSLQAVEAVSHEDISNVYKVLNLTPSSYLNELMTGTGSYITAIDSEQNSKNAYEEDFPGCANHLTTTDSGQKVLVCVNNPSNYINARIIGTTKTYQYTLELIMRPSVWKAHQNIWQQVEKSFSFK